MSRKILLTTTAIALAAGLTAAQAQTSSRDRTSGGRMQNAQSQDTTSSDAKSDSQRLNSTHDDRINSQADRAQNTQSPQASPSGSSAHRSGSQSKSNTAQSTSPRGSQAGDKANDTSRSSASDSSRSGTASSHSNASDHSRSEHNSRTRSASPSSERSSSARTSESSNRASANQSSERNAGKAASSVQLSDQQRTRIAASISAQKIEPVTKVNFSISVGTRVPQSVHLHTVSADIVSTVPQYRGYSYFVTNNQIVIVEPRTYEIVSVLPYGGGGRTASAAVSTKQKTSKFSSAQRETIKKRIVARPARTTVTQTREITVGDEVPETIILEDMPETVYTEVPGARPYRYYRTNRDVVIVDPADRHIVDVLD
jgi:hypothetical protein